MTATRVNEQLGLKDYWGNVGHRKDENADFGVTPFLTKNKPCEFPQGF